MKRIFVALTNIIIILFLMTFMASYAQTSIAAKKSSRIQEFENTNAGLIQTTSSYFYGAQEAVYGWGNYINAHSMTIDEAIEFVRLSIRENDVSGQILFTDELYNYGLCTGFAIDDETIYEVSFIESPLIRVESLADYVSEGRQVNISRNFASQLDGRQSVAFYTPIELVDEEDGRTREAVVMSVRPISTFDYVLQMNAPYFETASTVVLTSSGSYISKNASFENTNLFQFLNANNDYTAEEFANLKATMPYGTGTLQAYNAAGKLCYYSYATDPEGGGFFVVSVIPDEDILIESSDYTLAFIMSFGLLFILLFNIMIIAGTNAKLNQALKEADRANRTKTEFLSTMSHDIRTPLNAILGFTSVAKQQIDEKEAVEKNLEQISVAGNHLLMLVNDILDVAQIESRGIHLNPSVVCLEDSLKTIQSIADPIAEEKKIQFTIEKGELEHPYVLADQLRLNQIMINLVGNALKYTPDGGEVSLHLQEIPSKKEGVMTMEVVISDTGIGMSRDFLSKMYNSFSRAEDSRTSKVTGSGLGLAITKHLVDLMDGDIQCVSEVGKGTTFTVHLSVPIAEAPEQQVTETLEGELDGMHLLVAEDNDLNWEIVETILQMNGVSTERAVNGEEAVNMVRNNPHAFDLVLMDLRMPVMDGFEATRKIRESEEKAVRDIPIIAVTADAFAENVNECLQAGMNAHVAKPIVFKELKETILRIRESTSPSI